MTGAARGGREQGRGPRVRHLRARAWALRAVIAVGVFMSTLDSSIVNIACHPSRARSVRPWAARSSGS